GASEVKFWTHKIDGLHEADFVMAAKVDEVYDEYV
ncbi:MAG: 4a-hydroxytetrahydrobiopterin dehydratase, partial [Halobacteria archaeon]